MDRPTAMEIASVSVVAAAVIGGIEALGMVGDLFGLASPLWQATAVLNEHLATIGYMIIAIFVVSWIAAAVICRMRSYVSMTSATTMRIRNRCPSVRMRWRE